MKNFNKILLLLLSLFINKSLLAVNFFESIGKQLQGISLRHYQGIEKKVKYKTKIAIVDTGIDIENEIFFKKVYLPSQDKVSTKKFGQDFSHPNVVTNGPTDENGHGTHVAGIVVGVNPNVELLIVKYFNPKASNQEGLHASNQALKFAIDAGVDIINYSGGGPFPSEEERNILLQAEQKGIIVVASAGNSGVKLEKGQHEFFPASYNLDNFINVAATDFENQIIKESNYGKSIIHLSAPGKNIISNLPKKRLGLLSGSSQATAFVTGVVALIKGLRPELKAKEIKEIVLSTIKKIPTHANKTLTGGVLNSDEAIYRAITSK